MQESGLVAAESTPLLSSDANALETCLLQFQTHTVVLKSHRLRLLLPILAINDLAVLKTVFAKYESLVSLDEPFISEILIQTQLLC